MAVAITHDADERVIIDLSAATFLEPASLIAIAVVADRAALNSRPVTFVEPRSSDCAAYASRMHLGEVLGDLGISHHLRPVAENDVGDRLVELRYFEGEDGIEELADTVHRTLQPEASSVAQRLYNSLFEMGQNASEHSGRPGGYLALQRYTKRGDVAFSVGDSGMGIRASLLQTREVGDDQLAITLAVQDHVTSTSQAGRGRGLGTVVGVTRHHQGHVALTSGYASGVFRRGHTDPEISMAEAAFPGTLAQARLALHGV